MARIHGVLDIELLLEGYDTWLEYWQKKKANDCSNVQCLSSNASDKQVRYAYVEQTKLVPLCKECGAELSKGKILSVLDSELLPIPFLGSRELTM